MNYHFLTKTALFQGISEEEIPPVLECLGVKQKCYAKGTYIYHAGNVVSAMGLVLAGSVRVESIDVWGNTTVLAHVNPGQTFAEAYACLPGEPLRVSVIAAEDCKVLLMEVGRLLKVCPNTCSHHSKILANLMILLARKNLELSQRAFHVAPKTIRDKTLSYLSDQSAQRGCATFSIPFNRQQFADYLGVDRSALSTELGKMQREGLIAVDRSQFTLYA